MPSPLDLAYCVGLAAAAPWLAYKAATTGKYRAGWGQKLFGRVPPREDRRRCLWLHAVSVGEVLALRPLMPRLREQFPDWQLVISSTTNTGLEMVHRHFAHAHPFYFPLDFTWAIRRTLERIRPDAVALVELELWPQFVKAVHRRGIPLLVINGRMSPRSFRGYSRLRGVVRPTFGRIDLFAVQNEEYAERFAALGAKRHRIVVTGSIKYDSIETDRTNPRTAMLRHLLGIHEGDTVFVAGSTQTPEEELALDAYEQLLPDFPQLRLILVPRHQERFDEVARLLERRSVPHRRRSRLQSSTATAPHFRHARQKVRAQIVSTQGETIQPLPEQTDRPVILVDTLGELSAIWGMADLAFVGGSLSGRGGQNMIEPAAYGAAVLFGPDTWNFRETVDALMARDAALVVNNRHELSASLRRLLNDPAEARQLGQRARSFVLSQQGATTRTVECLKRLILPATTGATMPNP